MTNLNKMARKVTEIMLMLLLYCVKQLGSLVLM